LTDADVAIEVVAAAADVVRRRHGTDLARFAKGAGDFATTADPFSGETFWTDGRASHVRVAGRDTPLAPSAASQLVDLNLDPPFPSAPGFRAATLAGDLRFLDAFKPRVVSTSLALAWVATGQRAAYVTDGVPRDSVHFAAAIAICEAAGCVVTDVFGDAWGRGPTGLLAAADAGTHESLVRLTRSRLQ